MLKRFLYNIQFILTIGISKSSVYKVKLNLWDTYIQDIYSGVFKAQKYLAYVFVSKKWKKTVLNDCNPALESTVAKSRNGILLPKLFWPAEKKMFNWVWKTFEIRGWRPRICEFFEIIRTIYSNSERSEQFLVTECFFNLFLEVSQTW